MLIRVAGHAPKLPTRGATLATSGLGGVSAEARLTCTLFDWLKLHSCNNVRFAKSVADISQY